MKRGDLQEDAWIKLNSQKLDTLLAPGKAVLIFVTDHKDNKPGEFHASQLGAYDHVAVAWKDEAGHIQFREVTQGSLDYLTGPGAITSNPALGSVSTSGTAEGLFGAYEKVDIVPLELQHLGPDAGKIFINLVAQIQPGKGGTYSFGQNGEICTTFIFKALLEIPAFKAWFNGENPGTFSPPSEWLGAKFTGLAAEIGTLHIVRPDDLYTFAVKLLASSFLYEAIPGPTPEVVFRLPDGYELRLEAADVVTAISSVRAQEDPSPRLQQVLQAAKEAVWLQEIQAHLRASPSAIVVIVLRDSHNDDISRASLIPLPSGRPGFDHVAVAWMEDGELKFGQMVTGDELVGPFKDAELGAIGSISKPEHLGHLAHQYNIRQIVPLDLSPYGEGVRDLVVAKLAEALKPGNTYSFLPNGHTCTSAVFWALGEAFKEIASIGTGQIPWQKMIEQLKTRLADKNLGNDDREALEKYVATLSKLLGDEKAHSVTPNDLYLLAIFLLAQGNEAELVNGEVVFNLGVYEVRFEAADVKAAILHWAPELAVTEACGLHVLLQQIEELRELHVQPDNPDTDSPNSSIDVESRAFVDVSGSLPEKMGDAVRAEDARTDDAAQQTETDDDEEASQEQAAPESDSETNDAASPKPVTGDKQTAPSEYHDNAEESAGMARREDDSAGMAHREDDSAGMAQRMEAKDTGGMGVPEGSPKDATDQAEPQLATSAPDTLDDGFSYAAFPKQGVPVEVAKEALPADHLSPEAIPGPGMPAGESALPDVASEDVGNAAPSNERVVHHGDLAP